MLQTGRLVPVAAVGVFLSIVAYAAQQGFSTSTAPLQQGSARGVNPSASVAPPGTIGFRIYHVDFENGDDAAAGTKPSQPWKHAPGDANATGLAKSVKLNPGDIVRFKSGVRYRGYIQMPASGSPGKPITYDGLNYPSGRAILDGGEEMLETKPCQSRDRCGGHPNWQDMLVVVFDSPATQNVRIYDDVEGTLFEVQTPDEPDPFWSDELTSFATIPMAQAAQVAQGKIVDAGLAAAAHAAPFGRLLIWVQGNAVLEREILSVSGNTITFDATGVVPYTDRDGRAAVLGSIPALSRRGQYARIGTGLAIIYPREGSKKFYVGSGRAFFNIAGKSNIRITGFQFEHGTSAPKAIRDGIGIANYQGSADNLLVDNNYFYSFSMRSGYGVMHLVQGNGITVRNNVVDQIHAGSGFRFGSKTDNLLVEKNRLQNIGRTGIYFGGGKDGIARYNVMANMKGVHGNGMSFYRNNVNTQVVSNCVYATTRPLTFEGTNDASFVNDMTLSGNILISNDEGRSAIYSWGADMNTVLMENNVAIAPRAGIVIAGPNHAITIRYNLSNDISASEEADVTIHDNIDTLDMGDIANYTLNPGHCEGPGYYGNISISAL